MFKVVFVFGVIVGSAAGEGTYHAKLSRHAELSKPSNQANQTIAGWFGKPIIDHLNTQQQKRLNSQDPKAQAGEEPLKWLLKCSPTNYSSPPVEKMKVPYKNVALREEDRNQTKLEKITEVETSHPKEKREATTIAISELNLLNDWMENKVKVSHISNIYIGESMYPFMYEKSRVFRSESNSPSSGESSRPKEVKKDETRPKVPVYEVTKIYEIK